MVIWEVLMDNGQVIHFEGYWKEVIHKIDLYCDTHGVNTVSMKSHHYLEVK